MTTKLVHVVGRGGALVETMAFHPRGVG